MPFSFYLRFVILCFTLDGWTKNIFLKREKREERREKREERIEKTRERGEKVKRVRGGSDEFILSF